METAARAARYAFFGEVAAHRDCQHLLLAHHADDQVETFLFHLLRGSGSGGLRGMRTQAVHVIGQRKLTVWRPLLGTWREEIDEYVSTRGLDFLDDPTNANLAHTRNRLRHEILPYLEAQLDRPVRPALWRAAALLAAEDEWLESQTPLLDEAAELAPLRALPLALQRRALHRWLQARAVPNIDFADIENLRGLLHEVRPSKINLSQGWHARRRAGRLWLDSPSMPQATAAKATAPPVAHERRKSPKPTSHDQYLAALHPLQRAALESLRQAIKTAAPKAEECICYGLPAFRLEGRFLLAYGAGRKHCAFYPGAVIEALRKPLRDYDTSKGTIRFAADHPLPVALVRKIVKLRLTIHAKTAPSGGKSKRKQP